MAWRQWRKNYFSHGVGEDIMAYIYFLKYALVFENQIKSINGNSLKYQCSNNIKCMIPISMLHTCHL